MTVGGGGTKDDVSFATWASGQRSPSGGKQGSIQGSYYPSCIGNVMRWSLLAVSGWKARAYRGSFWEKRREEDYNGEMKTTGKDSQEGTSFLQWVQFWTVYCCVSRRKVKLSHFHADYWNFPPKINSQTQRSKLIQLLLPQREHNAIFITCLLWVQCHQSDTLKMPLALPNNHAQLNPNTRTNILTHTAGWNITLSCPSRAHAKVITMAALAGW